MPTPQPPQNPHRKPIPTDENTKPYDLAASLAQRLRYLLRNLANALNFQDICMTSLSPETSTTKSPERSFARLVIRSSTGLPT